MTLSDCDADALLGRGTSHCSTNLSQYPALFIIACVSVFFSLFCGLLANTCLSLVTFEVLKLKYLNLELLLLSFCYLQAR